MKNIVLIGLPGCGKTTFGRKLAQQKSMEFIDIDSIIEQQEEMSITEIFEKYDEAYFRALETKAALNASNVSNSFISAGGGIILAEENMLHLRKNGIILFINRDPAAILKDIQTKTRPLMQNDPNRIMTLYQQRIDLYRQYADYEIKNDDKQMAYSEMEQIADIAKRKIKLAVIGDPIAHSLSPEMHLPVLSRLCEHAEYEKVHVEKYHLDQWIQRFQKENFDGFNVTMPHKIDIIPFLNELDEDADFFHSVNTVVKRNGKLYGYNTDGNGFLEMIREKGFSFKDTHTLILGAGGAAATIALKIAKQKASQITVLARTISKAQMIYSKIKEIDSDITVNYDDMTMETLSQYCGSANILINATPLGMKNIGSDFEEFGFLKNMQKESLICDLIYFPMKTKLLIEAEHLGLNIIGGIGMLCYQAILADEIFLNKKINLSSMRNIAMGFLERKVD